MISVEMVGANQLVAKLDRMTLAIEREVAAAISELIADGAAIHRANIDRIRTGHMIGSVGHRMKTASGGVIEGEFGWTAAGDQYFRYQERGTSYIAPMYALADAGTQVGAQFYSVVAAAVRRAMA